MKPSYYRLDVEYPAQHRSPETDGLLERAVGADIGGSGCGFGQRVLEFYFEGKDARAQCIAAKGRLLNEPLPFHIKYYVSRFEEQ